MNLTNTFSELKAKNETALIPYITAGYPDMRTSLKHAKTLADHGADVIEIGLPFSDPIADGPTIQKSSQEALKNGSCLKELFNLIHLSNQHVPLILMSYLNPLLAYGETLFNDLKQTGFSGLIVPDLPVEEGSEWIDRSRKMGIDLIFLVAPTSEKTRIRMIAKASSGFIYCVTSLGTTGMRKTLPQNLAAFLGSIRNLTNKPIAAGFGISSPEQITQLKEHADGIIVGSRIIKAIQNQESLGNLTQKLKSATRFRQGGVQ